VLGGCNRALTSGSLLATQGTRPTRSIATASHGGISRNLNLDFRESPKGEVRLIGVLGSSLLGMLQAVGHDGTIEGVDSLL
jgi:hypothetical protein